MIDESRLPDIGQPLAPGENAPPAAQDLPAPPHASGAPDSRDPTDKLIAVAADLLKMGFAAMAKWIQQWLAASTSYSSLSDEQARAGERVVLLFHGCDDEATITFNGEVLATKQLGEAETRHRSSVPIQRSMNYWVLAVNNKGAGMWWVAADLYEESSGRHISRAVFTGNDFLSPNLHMFTCRIEGV